MLPVGDKDVDIEDVIVAEMDDDIDSAILSLVDGVDVGS